MVERPALLLLVAVLAEECCAAHSLAGTLSFVQPSAGRQILARRSSTGLGSKRRAGGSTMVMKVKEDQTMSRRNFGTLAAWMFALTTLKLDAQAAAPKTKNVFFDKDVANGFQGYVKSSGGVLYKDVKEGLGVAPKDGDMVRFQLGAYFPDGTIVSRMEGVERKITLGNKEVPPGLEEGLRGMKVDGERILVLDPDIGFDQKYRRRAAEYMRGCPDEASCRLDTDKLIVRVILIGYNKAECLDGDMPISMDTSPLMSEGKVKFTIGSDKCPQGNTEVTAQRIKTLNLINKFKQEGKLQAAEKQEFKMY